jgi:hypothetical protein
MPVSACCRNLGFSHREDGAGTIIARLVQKSGANVAFHPTEPFEAIGAKVGCGAGRAVPNAKLSDREGSTPAVRSQTSEQQLFGTEETVESVDCQFAEVEQAGSARPPH